MSAKETIISYLRDTVGVCINGLGDRDNKVNKLTEADMGQIFEQYLTGNDGDKVPNMVLIAESGEPYAYNGKYFECITTEALQYAIKRVMADSNVGKVYQFNSQKD